MKSVQSAAIFTFLFLPIALNASQSPSLRAQIDDELESNRAVQEEDLVDINASQSSLRGSGDDDEIQVNRATQEVQKLFASLMTTRYHTVSQREIDIINCIKVEDDSMSRVALAKYGKGYYLLKFLIRGHEAIADTSFGDSPRNASRRKMFNRINSVLEVKEPEFNGNPFRVGLNTFDKDHFSVYFIDDEETTIERAYVFTWQGKYTRIAVNGVVRCSSPDLLSSPN